MSSFFTLVLCVLCAVIAVAQGQRFTRASSSSGSSSGSYSSSGSGSHSGGGNFMFPSASFNAARAYAAQNPAYAPMFHQQYADLMARQQAAMFQNTFAFPNVDYNSVTPEFPSYGGNPVQTSASVNYGPQGGAGQASSYPGGPDGLGTRIADEFPAPSGGSFGVFTSSSSGTSDVDGRRTSFKTSTFGTNDNGRITFRTINE